MLLLILDAEMHIGLATGFITSNHHDGGQRHMVLVTQAPERVVH